MKTKLMVLMLLVSGALMAGTHVSIGIGVGGPAYYPASPVVAYAPPCPGPGYYWAPGYWYTVGHHRFWRAGYWAPRAHYRVEPRYYRHEEFREHRYYRDHDRDRYYRDRDDYRYRGR